MDDLPCPACGSAMNEVTEHGAGARNWRCPYCQMKAWIEPESLSVSYAPAFQWRADQSMEGAVADRLIRECGGLPPEGDDG